MFPVPVTHSGKRYARTCNGTTPGMRRSVGQHGQEHGLAHHFPFTTPREQLELKHGACKPYTSSSSGTNRGLSHTLPQYGPVSPQLLIMNDD
jgi:hypothetical protein